jgi:hypothetical protein
MEMTCLDREWPGFCRPHRRGHDQEEKQMWRFLGVFLGVIAVCNLTPVRTAAQAADRPAENKSLEHNPDLNDFRAFEFRRYTIKAGERAHFAQYFENYFPEAFEQLGAIAAGSFFERKNQSGFTWIRGFHTIDDRAVVNAAFYYGPLWKEHKKTLNDLMIDSDNVMLLCPLSSERSVTVLPAVDPVTEATGAHGVVVAQVFAVKATSVEAFAKEAESTFANYRAAGAREAGVLVTLDVAPALVALTPDVQGLREKRAG